MQYAPDEAVSPGGTFLSLAPPDGDQPVRSRNMQAIQGAAQEAESARAAIVLIAAGLVIFWRQVLRVLLAIIAIAVMVTVGSGAIALLHSMHR
jgi:hypothetical protein